VGTGNIPEGNMLQAGDSGRKHPALQRGRNMRPRFDASNTVGRMTAMPNRNPNYFSLLHSEMPALRVGDEEIAEYLNTRDRFELFRINKVSVECERVGFAEKLYQATILLDQIVR